MKKLLFIFMAFALLFASASLVSATLYYGQTWEDGTARYRTVNAGESVAFAYQSYNEGSENWVETDINLLFRGEADEPVANLLNEVSQEGTNGVFTIDTTGFTQGHYIIQGTAYDLVTGDNWTSLLEFFVYSDIVDTNNTPPYFLSIDYFVYDVATTQEAVVLEVADYARDADGDELSYALDMSGTDTEILNCDLYQDEQGTLACEFYATGETSVTILANDGEFPTSTQVFFTIVNSSNPSENNPPYFNNLERYYTYDLYQTTAVSVVDLADFSADPDGDTLTYSIDDTLTNDGIIDCELQGSVLFCDLLYTGQTRIDVSISDGEYEQTATLYITVVDTTPANTAPFFTDELDFTLSLADGMQNLVSLSSIADDAEDDELYFTLLANGQPGIADCSISSANNMLSCTPLSAGTTQLTIEVSDGELSDFGYFDVFVITNGTNQTNTPPELINVPPLVTQNYSYLDDFVVLSNVSSHGYDEDGDELFYSLDTSATDSSVVGCTLANDELSCKMHGVGQTSVDLIVFDGQAQGRATITIQIIDTTANPVAVITGPTSAEAYAEFSFDGSSSIPASGKEIVKYQWTIRNADGNIEKMMYGKTISTSLAEKGVYTVQLLVADEDGRQDTASVSLTITSGLASKKSDFISNRNLQVNSIQIMGSGYETAAVGDVVRVYITITNTVGYDLDDIHATFTIPDFGVRFKSKATSIEDEEKITLAITGHVPEYVASGIYYPEISVSAGDFYRKKIGYLEVRDE